MKSKDKDLKTRHLCISLFVGLFITISLGSWALWMGTQDNNNGEYFNPQTGAWDISYAISHFAAPAVIGLFATIFLFFSLRSLYHFKKRYKEMESDSKLTKI